MVGGDFSAGMGTALTRAPWLPFEEKVASRAPLT